MLAPFNYSKDPGLCSPTFTVFDESFLSEDSLTYPSDILDAGNRAQAVIQVKIKAHEMKNMILRDSEVLKSLEEAAEPHVLEGCDIRQLQPSSVLHLRPPPCSTSHLLGWQLLGCSEVKCVRETWRFLNGWEPINTWINVTATGCFTGAGGESWLCGTDSQ